MFFFFISVLSWLGRRPIGDWSATSRGPVPDRSATSCIKSQRGPHEVADQSLISRQPVPDKSPTSRRPTAKPSCDSSATSAIILNFGRGEVAERLQCMSDLGFRLCYCFTPYQRLWLYNGGPLVAFYDTLGIRRTYSRLKPPASSRGLGRLGSRKQV